jgi:hypothetical protein
VHENCAALQSNVQKVKIKQNGKFGKRKMYLKNRNKEMIKINIYSALLLIIQKKLKIENLWNFAQCT